MTTKAPEARVDASDFETNRHGPKLSSAQIIAIKRMAYYRACLMRTEAKWSPAEEAAYMNGVMSAFHACGNALDIPACWVMSGKPLLDLLASYKADGKRLW
jgi:hypothetical protein